MNDEPLIVREVARFPDRRRALLEVRFHAQPVEHYDLGAPPMHCWVAEKEGGLWCVRGYNRTAWEQRKASREAEAEVRVEMVDPQGEALAEMADGRKLTRDDVALTYAFMLRQDELDRVDEVNQAIVERWSLNALGYIKRQAWKIFKGDT